MQKQDVDRLLLEELTCPYKIPLSNQSKSNILPGPIFGGQVNRIWWAIFEFFQPPVIEYNYFVVFLRSSRLKKPRFISSAESLYHKQGKAAAVNSII